MAYYKMWGKILFPSLFTLSMYFRISDKLVTLKDFDDRKQMFSITAYVKTNCVRRIPSCQ